MNKKINFNEPFISGDEIENIKKVFSSNQFYGLGYFTKKCESAISKITNSNSCILTDSCTSALEIVALLLRDFEKQQEIIMPSYTFSSTASAFARAGFKIIFCEINPNDMMINVEDVKKRITKETVAIVSVHYGGQAADVISINELCKSHNIYHLEDSAQAFNSYFQSKHLGTFGDFGTISFHETKNIHSGLGGALLVNNDLFETRARYILERGTNRQQMLKGIVDKYTWVEIGGSFAPTELQAAFLLAQLNNLGKNHKKREQVYKLYKEELHDLIQKEYFTCPMHGKDFQSNFHAFFIMLKSSNICDNLRSFLNDNGISSYIGYVPLHSSPVGKKMGYQSSDFQITEEYSKRLLRLPFHNNLSKENIYEVTKLIKLFFKENV